MTNNTYKNNFIDQVIIRYDFVAPIVDFDNGLPIELRNIIISKFPIVETLKSSILTPQALGGILSDATIYTFQSNEREKILEFGKSYCAIIFKKFTSFNNLISEITPINEILFSPSIKISINRIGLRFINQINLPGKNPLNWSNY
ncbi:MAG: TIGR04255 family protein, partial [Methanospirillum sp.]|uniref:TIGR04255 family protein n=1 Tax=Methanospirillum sp. TaxID=45200 RepID=UPI0023737D83